MLKDQGPMDPSDVVIQHELEMCSTEAQVVICEAGGISKFLRQSLQFAVVDGYICLASDAGKARQLARSHRQLLHKQQPQVKINPPVYMSASASHLIPNAPTVTTKPVSAYRSLAGMDISSSSRIIPGLSQQSDFQLTDKPAFLSQPAATQPMFPSDIKTSADKQTTLHRINNYNDSGIKTVNGNTKDSWMTVSKATKSSSGVRNPDHNSSGAIGELDDFFEPFTSENNSGVGEWTLNEATVNDIPEQNYKQFINVPGSSGSDESSVDSSSSSGSVDEEDNPAGKLDSLDTEVADTCAVQQELTSMALSVTAPEFIPLSFASNQPTLITSVGKSSPKMSTSSQAASSGSRPSSRAAATSEKLTQTDDGWIDELQQLKDSHTLVVAQLEQQQSQSTAQLQVSLCCNMSNCFTQTYTTSF